MLAKNNHGSSLLAPLSCKSYLQFLAKLATVCIDFVFVYVCLWGDGVWNERCVLNTIRKTRYHLIF